MRWRDRYSWTSIDAEDSIVITVVRDRAKVGWIFGALFIGIFFVLGFVQKSWLWLIFSLFGLASTIFDRLRGDISQLTVTTQELVVRGHVDRTFDDQLQIDTKGLRSLEYFSGGEDNPSGLYANGRFSQTCLLPGLNEQQSIEIALLIHRRFPDLGAGDTESRSLLFGKSADLTSLNLSKPRE